MKWIDGVAIFALALSGVCFAALGVGGGGGSGEVVAVGADGSAAAIDAVLGAGEVGLVIAQAEPAAVEEASLEPAAAPASSEPVSPEPVPLKPAGSAASPCVNINTADEKQLMALNGVGPVLAAAIVEHRGRNGRFRKKEDLKKVKGIGPAKYAKVADHICL